MKHIKKEIDQIMNTMLDARKKVISIGKRGPYLGNKQVNVDFNWAPKKPWREE